MFIWVLNLDFLTRLRGSHRLPPILSQIYLSASVKDIRDKGAKAEERGGETEGDFMDNYDVWSKSGLIKSGRYHF